MPVFVLPLDSTQAGLDRVGGKGANLAELVRAGFTVPPGFLVTTEAYRAFVTTNRIAARIVDLARAVSPDDLPALEQASEQIRELFEQGEVPEEIAEAILSAYRALTSATSQPGSQAQERGPGGESAALPVAVRSSATAEDLPGLSFAGQQDTYLNIVGPEAVQDAVRRCWGSLWTARAIGYRARNHIPPDDVALAVVVQSLVPSEVSGVLFTANPLSGRRDEIVIDASFGLGEAIVSGQVEPDHYVVDPHSWQIASRKLGAKALAILPRAGGGTEQIAQAGARQALPDEQILDLARTAGRVAEHFGSPQDIEWAWAAGQLYLLQSRPITSLYPLPTSAPRAGEMRVYWSLNSVQGVIDPFTPMGRDVIRQGLAAGLLSLFHVDRPAREVVVEAGGRLFIDITDITGVWIKLLGSVDPGAQQTLRRLIDQGRVALHNPFSGSRVRALLPTALPLLGRALATLQGPRYMRARALASAERFLAGVRVRVAEARTLDDLLSHLTRDLPAFVTRVLAQMFPVLLPAVASMNVVDRWLIDWLGLKPGAVFQLLRGLPGNVTSQMDLQLWAHTQDIRSDSESRATFLSQPIGGLVEAYERGELPAAAQRTVEQFLSRYGMRGAGEIDFGLPRWRDDPTPIFQTIHNYLQQNDADLAPDAVFARGAAESERLAAEWLAQVRRTRFGAVRAKLLALAIERMRALMGVREAPKFFIIQTFGIYRTALLEHARQLAARGELAQPDDIFFIGLDDLRRFAQGQPLDLKALVVAARADYDRERARRRMPRLLLNTGEVFYEGLSEAGSADLVGDPVSPGVVEGHARVVLEARGARLHPGEILVCPATDPGWTPLFLTAGGLVMEIGGLVTHGSVVAREYGIPAVVGVHDATTRLRTGQRIRVDGTQGRVTILEDVPKT